jgi:hypothetical protein
MTITVLGRRLLFWNIASLQISRNWTAGDDSHHT